MTRSFTISGTDIYIRIDCLYQSVTSLVQTVYLDSRSFANLATPLPHVAASSGVREPAERQGEGGSPHPRIRDVCISLHFYLKAMSGSRSLKQKAEKFDSNIHKRGNVKLCERPARSHAPTRSLIYRFQQT